MLTRQLEDSLRELRIEVPVTRNSVLLVDDEPEVLEALSAVLEESCDVLVARDAPEALALLDAGTPVDLVIADQRMPGMTGLELLGRVADQCPETVRVVLTAYGDVEPMLTAINDGSVDRFLLKTEGPEQVRTVVQEALRGKQATSLLRHLTEVLWRRRDVLDRTLQQLRAAQEQLVASERISTVGQAASGIVQNLRNITTIIAMLMDRIAREAVAPELLASAEAVLDSFDELIRPLETVRDFARASGAALQREPTDMLEFLHRTIAMVALEHGGGLCPVQVRVAPEVRILSLDADRMRQALVALIDNALRANVSGAPIELVVRKVQPLQPSDQALAYSPTRWVCLEVVDRGHGMDETTLSLALKPLYSGFSPPGLGLGLEIARLTAQMHGGRIELHSGPGQGTRAGLIISAEELPTC